MRRAIILIFTVFVALAGYAEGERSPAPKMPFANMAFFPVDHPECKGFVVIQERMLENRLYYVANDNSLKVFTLSPEDLLPEHIVVILLSPGKDKVLFLSAGEGHPEITVYSMGQMLRMADRALEFDSWDEQVKEMKVRCLTRLDPYPGLCFQPKWLDKNTIEFESCGIDFRVFDKELRRGKEARDLDYPGSQIWRWNIENDTFVLVSNTTAKPDKKKKQEGSGTDKTPADVPKKSGHK